MKHLRRLEFCTVLLALVVWFGVSPAAKASTSSKMDGYWTSSLGTVNATGPTAYKGQKSGYYTMGNLSLRTPQQNTQLLSVQLPSLSSGCGGIDIFTGGFSFVNADALIAEMKAIASNAVGFGFNLALKSICPMCHTIMTDLQEMAAKVNASQINSCQAAQALIKPIAGDIEAAGHAVCQGLGTAAGQFSDEVQGWWKCENNSTAETKALPADQQAFVPTRKNIGWEAVKAIQGMTDDIDFAAMVMTMTGTVVEDCESDGPGGCTYTWIQPAADDSALLNAMLQGGTFQGIQCDDQDVCLKPLQGGRTISIDPSNAFLTKVNNMLSDMVSRIIARQTLTSEEQAFLNMSPVPVYKMAAVYTIAEGADAQSTLSGYSELIATTVAIEFIKSSIRQIAAGAHNLQGVDQTQLDQWTQGINQTTQYLDQQEQKVATQVSAYEQIIDRTQRVEASLAGKIDSRFAQSYAFMVALKSR